MSRITISHTKGLKANQSITIPPSKSHTHRAILLASMSHGKSKIENILRSPDIEAMINGCSLMGAKILSRENVLFIEGCAGSVRNSEEKIDAANSGQVLRFLGAMLALGHGKYEMSGDKSIQTNRPILPLVKALNLLGASCSFVGHGKEAFPLEIKGPIEAGDTRLDGEDSQPVSALIMATSFIKGISTIEVKNPGETPWIDVTLGWLDRLGVRYENNNYESYKIYGNPSIEGFSYSVPGDFSSALYPIVAAIITKSKATIKGLDFEDSQGDRKVIDLLLKMGADIRIDKDSRTLTVFPTDVITGIDIDINPFIDALPILAVLGCFADGKTTIYNGGIARKKESDRIGAICLELKKMGANLEESEDGLIVSKSSLIGTNVEGHKDHRIVMSLFIAGLAAQNQTTITDIEYVKKSFPNFFEEMKRMGAEVMVL